MKICLILALYFVCFPTFSEENESSLPAEITIEMGGGKVHVEPRGINLDSTTLERLQTDLLVHPQLVTQVTGTEPVRVTLTGEDIDSIVREIHRNSEKYAEKIKGLLLKDLIISSIENENKNERGEGKKAGINIQDGADKVILGDNFTVGPMESYNDVVVLGGHVVVAGTVRDLVVLGGSVQLQESANLENLVVIGGRLESSPGAQIHGDKVLVNEVNAVQVVDGWIWSRVESFWHHVRHFFLALFAAWVAPLLLQKLTPNYFSRVRQRQNQSWGRNLFLGTGFIFGSLPLLILLIVSVVGILVVPAYSLMFVLLIMFGYALAVESVGRKLMKNGSPTPVVIALVSSLSWVVVGMVPILGFIIRFALVAMAIAALILALRETKNQPSSN